MGTTASVLREQNTLVLFFIRARRGGWHLSGTLDADWELECHDSLAHYPRLATEMLAGLSVESIVRYRSSLLIYCGICQGSCGYQHVIKNLWSSKKNHSRGISVAIHAKSRPREFNQVSHLSRPASHRRLTRSCKAYYPYKYKSPQSRSCTQPP